MNRQSYAVVDPATGELVREYPDADREWSKQTVPQRAGLLDTVAALHTARSGELARIAHREMGKPLDEAVAEVELGASI
ncbi:aldehyde dehydrogenase family protein [Amycolatopsis sp. NPDC089917]|uniref:aldehyde dehydrogenase family protein n=1 Tax=Amycolatopsis sp. NPDC089917 TaxID=3155187 RepID=UPI00343A15B3